MLFSQIFCNVFGFQSLCSEKLVDSKNRKNFGMQNFLCYDVKHDHENPSAVSTKLEANSFLDTLKVILLGQCLSILITGTGISSQLLADNYNISIPTTQSVLNYVLLSFYWLYIAYTRYYKHSTTPKIDEITTETPNIQRETTHTSDESLYIPPWIQKCIENKLIYVVLSLADVEANYLGNVSSV